LELRVLKGIDLILKRGEMLGIVGASGAGKSTLLHVLGTLDRPTEGTVYFEKLDIFRFSDAKLAQFRNKRIGFIFQLHHLLPEFNALENVLIPAFIAGVNQDDAGKKARRLLEEVGLKERLNHKPGELSGGEQQRVAVARALMNDPDLILADEPTGNLDSKTSDSVFHLLKRINQEKKQTFVIVTHNNQLAEKMDRIIHLADGIICREGQEEKNV